LVHHAQNSYGITESQAVSVMGIPLDFIHTYFDKRQHTTMLWYSVVSNSRANISAAQKKLYDKLRSAYTFSRRKTSPK
jgi:hypothetical protein